VVSITVMACPISQIKFVRNGVVVAVRIEFRWR
jgi:hypothetical protein